MTLDQILGKCHEVGDCLLWPNKARRNVPPQAYDERGQKGNARRIVYTQARGIPVPQRMVITPSCRNPACLNPDHLVMLTRKALQQRTAKEGGFSSAAKIASNAAAARARSRLTMTEVRKIRASTEPSDELAQRHGISVCHVRSIRSGRRWAEAANGASVFTWRPAA